ncbi:DUF6069 family protein [Cryptosporangium minutisporangium]|uniref:Uncharacterized protein n=1 Tax=Cryptosporangium minutisporangium TaxID=113569 RepID=A0ABP6TAP8_9ACTN
MASETVASQSDGRTRLRARALAVGGAVAANVALWVIGEPLLGHDLVVTQPGEEALDLGFGAIAVVSLIVALLGWASLAVLERVTRRARVVWTVVAVLVLAASFMPVLQVEASAGTKTVLALTHLAVGLVLIPVFWRTSTRRATPESVAPSRPDAPATPVH